MKKFLLMAFAIALPLTSVAQNYNDSPMLIMGGEQLPKQAATAPEAATPALPQTPPLPPNFPEWAVTNAAQNTAGNTNPQPSAPATPPTPATPAAAVTGAAPASPAAPAAPESPVNKLWPRDSVPIFVKSCVGFHVELIPACSCVITTLMATMPHDEFLRLSASGVIEFDPRLVRARQNCVATPGRKE